MRNLPPVRFATCWLLLVFLVPLSPVHAQPPSPTIALPKAIYAPKPVYRPEWARQGLKGKGVVLVTIDPSTGNVSGVQMAQSTGNRVLDGAAMQTYSQWRFEPGSIPQVKMPFEFAARPPGRAVTQGGPPRPASYWLLMLVGIGAVLFAGSRFLTRLVGRGHSKNPFDA
jgi:TonB family protein